MSTPSSRLLASRPVGTAARLTSGGLRVLAYHGVPDAEAFARQMEHLASAYDVTSGGAVAASGGRVDDGDHRRSVWITFDDGDPSVVENALPVLDRYELPATMFICPVVVETGDPLWFDLVQDIVEQTDVRPEGCGGQSLSGVMPFLKSLDDEHRRAVVARMAEAAPEVGVRRQVGRADLERWVDSGPGRELGNHSWDHPCLDRCEPGEAARQVRAAAGWLDDAFPGQPRTFAYPNGNWSQAAETALDEDGCAVALLFDHRLNPRSPDPLRLSRLRVGADAPLDRFAAIVSGAHAQVFRALRHHRRETPSRFPPRRRGRHG